MKEKFFIIIICIFFQFLIVENSYCQENITVRVTDLKGAPLADVSVSIDGSPFSVTNEKGLFTFNSSRHLVMPIKIIADKTGYDIEEYLFLDEQKEIEIIMKTVDKKKSTVKISLLENNKNPLKQVKVFINGESYLSDDKGMISYKGKMPDESKVKVDGYEIVKFDDNNKKSELNLELKKIKETVVVAPKLENNPKQENKEVKTEALENLPDTNVIKNLEYPEEVFQQYKEDFKSVENEIINERVWLEKKNAEIRDEIQQISDKLKNEKNLSSEERKVLEKYLDHLEVLLDENSRAFHKAEEKTKELMQKMRLLILAKDSINYLAKIQLAKVEHQKRIAERKIKRNAIIFSIVAGSLLILAIVFYFIALKMKKQKKNLLLVNESLQDVQKDLLLNMEEVKTQKHLVEEKNAQLDAFVYKASHDIKGPLKSVIGLTQTGIKSVADPVSKEYFDHILKSTLKLDSLVADLLKLTKAQQAEVRKSPVNVLNIVNECLASFQNIEDYKKMNFDINVSPDLTFNTDEKIFSSIVQNFIENAIKYRDPNKEKSTLCITALQTNNKIALEFEDNGIGIAQQHQDKIFNMFYKVDEGSNGTGLGLHIVKTNINRLNGDLSLSSEEGKGSSFTVTFNL